MDAGTIHRLGGSRSNVISCDFLSDSDYYDSKLSAFKFTCDTFAFNHWGYMDGSALSVTRLASSGGGTQTSILSTGSQTIEQYPDY